MIYVLSGLASFFVAMLAATLGIGGSFLLIPIFVWLGLDFKFSVVPMVLLLNLVISLAAQTSYLKKGLTDIKTGLTMSMVAVIFAQIGAYVSRYMQADTLMLIFAMLVLGIAVDIIFFNNYDEKDWLKSELNVNVFILIIAGAIAGAMSGLVGIGGGFIIMPVLLLVGAPPKRAAATSSLFVFFSSSSALLGHLEGQTVDLNIALICVACVAIGAKAGAILMTDKFKPKTVKKLFGFVMILIAVKIFYDAM